MEKPKLGFEETLAKKVLATGKCVGCGACVLVCPFNCLEYTEEKPHLTRECKTCGICQKACAQYDGLGQRTKNEPFGPYHRLVAAQATDDKILEVAQDGGAVTALLTYALENGIIDSAIVSGKSREKPFQPTPKLATTPKEILESAGTRYTYSPNILALAEAVKQKKKRTAFVGTPCQIQAIRKMQASSLKKHTAPLKLLIGLMCTECFTYEGLTQKLINQKLNLNPMDIKKINIKGQLQITTTTETKTTPLSEAKKYTRQECRSCEDFSSEQADISAGGLGLNGWTFTIIRTEKGQKLFSKAEKAKAIRTREAPEALSLLTRLSQKKKNRA